MRVLCDTNVISYWLAGEPSVQHGLQRARADFGRATFFVSVVTTQELMVWARLRGKPDGTYAFLASHFTSLDFTEPCALEAARLAALAGHPKKKAKDGTKAERREAVASWQRDAAIAATANQHGLDVLFTANEKDFQRFAPNLSCKLRGVA